RQERQSNVVQGVGRPSVISTHENTSNPDVEHSCSRACFRRRREGTEKGAETGPGRPSHTSNKESCAIRLENTGPYIARRAARNGPERGEVPQRRSRIHL